MGVKKFVNPVNSPYEIECEFQGNKFEIDNDSNSHVNVAYI
jgi:hypothetical protein